MLKIIDVIIALDLDVYDRENPDLQEKITGISIDSRTLQKGDLYIAIKGENTDGHFYIKDAIQKGASGIILDDEEYVNDCLKTTYFLVPNTLKALEKLAMATRVSILPTTKIIALTGSVGKTTLKEFLNTLLSPFYKTVSSLKSFNNHYGVPLSLCSLKDDTECGVFEIGMNHRGEIKPLVHMVAPHIAIITSIAPAHIGNMGSLDEIAKEKSDILSGILPGGVAILPFDSPYINMLTEKAFERASKIITIGKSEGANLRLLNVEYGEKGTTVWARIYGKEYTWQMPVFSEHFALLALFAVAVCAEMGLDVKDLMPYLSQLKPLSGRGELKKITCQNGDVIRLIDDSYNANIASMKAAIETLSRMDGKRKIAVLGDLAELGDHRDDTYKELADILLKYKPDLVFTVGTTIETLSTHLSQNINMHHASTVDDVIPIVHDLLKDEDMILIKGSNINKLSKLVDSLIVL